MAVLVEYSRWLSQVATRDGPPRWRGQQATLVKESAAIATMLSMRGGRWAGISGPTAPVCQNTRAVYHPQGLGNRVIVIGDYETPRLPNLAEVIVDISGMRNKKLLVDRDGKTIEGQGNLYQGEYQPLFDNYGVDYRRVIYVKTAYPAKKLKFGRIDSMRNRVNKTSVSIADFGRVSAGSLLCVGARCRRQIYAPYYDVDYMFEYSGPYETWNENKKTRPVAWLLQEAAGDTTRKVHVTISNKKWSLVGGVYVLVDAEDEKRKPFKTADFLWALQGLKAW